MEQARRLSTDTPPEEAWQFDPTPPPSDMRRANTVVVLPPASAGAMPDRGRGATSARVEKWPGLLERVRGAAHYLREVEDRAQEQELRVQELLEQVRADMQEASAKVRAAEESTRACQAEAKRLIQAAEERARLAETRAATAESWLVRISEAIETEFVVESAAPRPSDPSGA